MLFYFWKLELSINFSLKKVHEKDTHFLYNEPMAIFNIGQKIHNLNRFRTIVNVFAQHGFVTLLETLKIDSLLKRSSKSFQNSEYNQPGPVRLRRAFESLGPTFVKLGQVLSMREDLIPAEYILEFQKLQDQVTPFDLKTAKDIIQEELGSDITAIFKSFSPEPIAAASIGQVYKALLSDDTKVVVKVQRPNIEKIVNADLAILYTVAQMLDKIPEVALFRPSFLVTELDKAFRNELDYLKEATHTDRFQKNFSEQDDIHIPKVYWDLSSKRILTLEYMPGNSLSKIQKTAQIADYDLQQLSHVLTHAIFKQILIDGFFHADLHDGNILITKENTLAFIDFGIIGRLHQQTKSALANMFIALVAENYHDIINEFLDIAELPPDFDQIGFQTEIEELLDPYYDKPLSEIKFGYIIMQLARISAKYRAIVPRDLILLAKTFASLESFAKRLNPNLNIIEEGHHLSKTLLTSYIDPKRLMHNGMLLARDLSTLLKTLPRQLRIFTNLLNSGKVQLQVHDTNYAQVKGQIEDSTFVFASAIIVGALLIGSSILLSAKVEYLLYGYPFTWLIGGLGYGLALIISLLSALTWAIVKIMKRKR